ncbi:MAG: hypothetical protein KF721_09730 [Ignavibacteriaceae bacterium]|nr:hypothetical protein [Ignavibacteriaceae bacterium]
MKKVNDHKLSFTLFLSKASEDYVAFRCCILNDLFSGFVFAAQAVERIMKSYMFIFDENYNPKKDKHRLVDLSKKIQSICNCSLDNYSEIFEKLDKHYNSRYPDNADYAKTRSTAELNPIDSLVYNLLFEHLPIHDDIKYISPFTSILFPIYHKENYYEKKQLPKHESSWRFWLLSRNQIFQKNYAFLAQKWIEISQRDGEFTKGSISPYCNSEIIDFSHYNKSFSEYKNIVQLPNQRFSPTASSTRS